MQRALNYSGVKFGIEIPVEVRISDYATFKKILSNFYFQT